MPKYTNQKHLIDCLVSYFKEDPLFVETPELIKELENGVCFALSCMSMLAVQRGDYNTFNKQCDIISSINSRDFPNAMNSLKEKRIEIVKKAKQTALKEIGELYSLSDVNEEKLTKDQKKLLDKKKNEWIEEYLTKQFTKEERIQLDIPVFLEDVLLVQKYIKLSPLISSVTRELYQNILQDIDLIMTDDLRRKGGLALVNLPVESLSGLELVTYFKCLNEILAKSSIKNPVTFMLSGHNHTIAISYDIKTKEWIPGDPNQIYIYEDELSSIEMDDHEIAKYTSDAFREECSVFQISAIASKNDEFLLRKLNEALQSSETWQQLHREDGKKGSRTLAWLLYTYIKRQDTNSIKDLIQKGVDVNVCMDKEITNLALAVHVNNIDIVSALLVGGANPNGKNDCNHNPLHDAVYCANLDIIKLLLDSGAKPGDEDREGASSLTRCIFMRKMNLDKIPYIVKGVPVFSLPREAYYHYVNDLSVMLVNYMSATDINTYSRLGFGVIEPELKKKLMMFLGQFLPSSEVSKIKSVDVTPLMIATFLGDIETVKLLLDKKGVDATLGLALEGKTILTPLDCAKMLQNKELISLLEHPPQKQSELLGSIGFMKVDGTSKQEVLEKAKQPRGGY